MSRRGKWGFIAGGMCVGILFFVGQSAFAVVMSSPDYRLDANATASVGGPQNSTNYKLSSTAGESVIGNGASGSYLLKSGYTAELIRALDLTVTPTTSLGPITPGTSATTPLTMTVRTDAPGYSIAVNQDHDLQFSTNTIPGVSGTIASPLAWTEGTTKGLGFSLASSTGTAPPPKWSSGSAYAAFPGAGTTMYTRTGYTGGATDSLTINVRADVTASQVSGAYTNTVTWTGTMTP